MRTEATNPLNSSTAYEMSRMPSESFDQTMLRESEGGLKNEVTYSIIYL